MAAARPEEIIRTYPSVIDRIFNNLESENVTIIGVSLDTLGNIAATDKGKFALETSSGMYMTVKHLPEENTTYLYNVLVHKVGRVLPILATLLGSLPTELKIRALKTLESLLNVQDITSKASTITFKWFRLLGENFIEKIVSYAKNPFGEIRLAGLGVLFALASQQWGQEAIQQVPGNLFAILY